MNRFTGFVCFSVEASGEVSAIKVKVKVTFTPRTGQEGPEGE
jgi:hypothetical protein